MGEDNNRIVRKDENTIIRNMNNDHHNYYGLVNMENAKFPSSYFLGTISFQRGPIKVAGVNGFQHEELVAIIIDRLQFFQSEKLSCEENEQALKLLQEALTWMEKRKQNRIARNVEGTSEA